MPASIRTSSAISAPTMPTLVRRQVNDVSSLVSSVTRLLARAGKFPIDVCPSLVVALEGCFVSTSPYELLTRVLPIFCLCRCFSWPLTLVFVTRTVMALQRGRSASRRRRIRASRVARIAASATAPMVRSDVSLIRPASHFSYVPPLLLLPLILIALCVLPLQ